MMSLGLQAAGGLAVVLLGILFFSRTTDERRTLRSFFWANRELGPLQGAMLVLATSLSLNGLLYQSWLGYKTGIYSIVIQLVFCSGFILLYVRADRFFELLADTIHGNFRSSYGSAAGTAAAIASSIGFASLAGWELSIAASILQSSLNLAKDQTIYLLLLFALVPALYTMRGGLRGNVKVNIFLNFLACGVIVVLVGYLVYTYVSAGTLQFTLAEFSKRAKWDAGDAVVAVGGAAVISNLLFSFFWQSADMNLWENASGAGETTEKLRRTLLLGAGFVLIAPGVLGAFLGMAVQHLPDVNEANVLDILIQQVSSNPHLGIIMGIALFASLIAVMLSTLDGLFLSGALSFAADVVFRGDARRLLDSPAVTEEDRAIETKVLATAYLFILLMAVVGSLLFLLVQWGIVDLFRMVYLAVIGTMSLVPGVMFIIFTRDARLPSHRNGLASVAMALAGSWLLVALVLLEIGPFRSGLLDWMPMITIGLGIIGLLLPRHAIGDPPAIGVSLETPPIPEERK